MRRKTSWSNVSRWYDKSVGTKGHFYHQSVIFPRLMPLMGLRSSDRVLDLGCGQGVLGRQIPAEISYCGVDWSKEFVAIARQTDTAVEHRYLVGDVTHLLLQDEFEFSHIVFLLSLQNMQNMQGAIESAARYLQPGGRLFLVLNHPCFRIPRHTSWGVDESQKLQYRRVNRYMSDLEMPIDMEPGKKRGGQLTWSYHVPLHVLSGYLSDSDLVIEKIEEWNSERTSQGKARKMENLARSEIPLFMCMVARPGGQ